MSRFPPPPFLTCTTRPSRASRLPLPANFPFLVLIGSPILLPLVLLFPPRRVDLLVPPTERKEAVDIAASPSILVALLICCSARNTAHVGDLYPASFNSSVRLISFRVVIISACSWPSQHFCFFCKFYPLLVIVHPRPGSRHVVRPSVVMILVSSTRCSHTCDESWILTKPPAGISCSRINV